MAECYLCGAYVAQGRGYRRNVQTGASTRYYFTRHGGTSYGVQHGLRTLCAVCATLEDRTREGAGARLALYLVGWGLSAMVGWSLLGNAEGPGGVLCGLAFLLGLPVFILGFIAEQARRSDVVNEVRAWADEDLLGPQDDSSIAHAAREDADAQAARKTNAEMGKAFAMPMLGLAAIIGGVLLVLLFKQAG